MSSDSNEALIQLIDAADQSVERSFWRSVGRALKRAAVATGTGTAWLARTGYENRNYLPAVLNGAVGDKLARAGEGLAIGMSFRHDRRDIPVAALAVSMADGDGRAAVFVHGLMGDELMWQQTLGGDEGLAAALERDRGVVPLYVRYNSGLHISTNGRALADLLESFARAHAGDVKTLTLVGHSMGGLVVRSAEHYGREAGHRWPELVDSIALLGAPHDGSYLEKLGHLTSTILETIPTSQTRIISRVIDERSDGIKDLRIGVLVDEDWQRPDAHSMPIAERTTVPLLPDARYHVVIGTLVGDHTSIVAAYLGDGLVAKGSALGTKRDELTDAVVYKVFPRTGHMALMTSPDVQQYLVEVL